MAQSHMMMDAEGRRWVVKFQNNPQHTLVLANELIATRLAAALSLTVPASEVVSVSESLTDQTDNLYMDHGKGRLERCCAGRHFGSELIEAATPGLVVDHLTELQLIELRNRKEFAGMLCLDKWTGNCDGRQAVFERRPQEQQYRASFIDQGCCFNSGEWTFPDFPTRGVYSRNVVYQDVTDWESFEPWLSLIEGLEANVLWKIAESVPQEWYQRDHEAMERLIEQMLVRQGRVRKLIEEFRLSNREPFPNWNTRVTVAVP